MRFQSPLLILGLSVPLALCQGGTVTIQLQGDHCIFQGVTPDCEGKTWPFAIANGNDCSDVNNSSQALCFKPDGSYGQVINMYSNNLTHISFAGGWCWLPSLEEGASCTVPAPSSSSMSVHSSTPMHSSTPVPASTLVARQQRED
ncbi:uncharacterized protein PFLUO_LOCUS2514 [Penicillium psychrofluorescens]|uniref:uncharacterized protein n=1 Tax=Penicillium psychrofluorescens TaxID=3158075 RepID=UPI003CCCF294